jgi:hypothetical protein
MRQLFTASAHPLHDVPQKTNHDRTLSLAACLMACLGLAACKPEPEPQYLRPQAAAVEKPKVNPRLLVREGAPKCAVASTASITLERPADASDAAADNVVKVAETAPAKPAAPPEDAQSRERDCYRDAEARVRRKLTQLQAAVRAMDAAERSSTVASR